MAINKTSKPCTRSSLSIHRYYATTLLSFMEDDEAKKESKRSSDDEPPPERARTDTDTGTGRSYECIYCRRGFSTAQALGGHMNLHRRDRGRVRPPDSVSPESSELFLPPLSLKSQGLRVSDNERATVHLQRRRELSLFHGEVKLDSDEQSSGSSMVLERVEMKGKDEEREELDLELRLGHDP